ncbi:alpha/beta hydrolase [Dickeya dianthicola]|nr:alpha/beta hydrolase [Dickeya dianthicola]MBT1431847.1 alpha/beta hydrolase [Dickeya dianthicola]MBT1459293.1 alpha/beta hydrolase [Dickeya dianthicola]MBT1488490.1 alpha/beta hydrolase [Dickeya dianthicola]QVH39824.1 alpha/beta hydrolase [Dickeya dianthicola]
MKEQTSGLYAQQLAKRGFITLAYDASHYGESGGLPRNLENPTDRVQDIRSAIGYLSSLPQVDAARGVQLRVALFNTRACCPATRIIWDIVNIRDIFASLPRDSTEILQKRVFTQPEREADVND